ncbi:MAG: hypothetical protein WC449_02255 [Candidatus Paceibacterota bacterium]
MNVRDLFCAKEDGKQENVYLFYVMAATSSGLKSTFLTTISRSEKNATNRVIEVATKKFSPGKTGGPELVGQPIPDLIFAWQFGENLAECQRRLREALEIKFPKASNEMKDRLANPILLFLAKVSGDRKPRFPRPWPQTKQQKSEKQTGGKA